jgi:hypothetical protein
MNNFSFTFVFVLESGFHCVPGFTHRFKQWSIDNEKQHKSRGGLVNVPENDPIRNDVKQIHVRKGSFIVWDSRLPHGIYFLLFEHINSLI